MIAVSQNEIAGMAVKACRGVGIDWGLAHDVGQIAHYLAACDTPFLGSLLKVLEVMDGEPFALADPLSMAAIPAPVASLALIEWIAVTGQHWQGEVVAPQYLFAALAIFTGENRGCFTVTTPSGAYHARGGTVQIPHRLSSPMMAEITFQQEGDDQSTGDKEAGDCLDLPPPRPGVSVEVSEGCWQRLAYYAHRTYVPESEHSRSAGAGAGDIDNE